MTERHPVTSDDLRAAAKLVAESIRHLDSEMYSKLAFGLEWTRSETAAHIASALFHYSAAMSRKSTDNPGSRGLALSEGSAEASALQIESNAEVLAIVAESTPPSLRSYHRTGNPVVEGLLAMGCVEVLLHGHGAVVGTEAEFDPVDSLCRRILGRLFPWALEQGGGWLTLLWATRRGDIESHDHLGETWMWHNDLLSEWDGTIPDSTIWITRN